MCRRDLHKRVGKDNKKRGGGKRDKRENERTEGREIEVVRIMCVCVRSRQYHGTERQFSSIHVHGDLRYR